MSSMTSQSNKPNSSRRSGFNIKNVENPYAIYCYCDGAMDTKSRIPGGIGIHIKFPDCVNLEPKEFSFGKYQDTGIERLELQALILGIDELIKIYHSSEAENLNAVSNIILVTDRFNLSDAERTNPYSIQKYKKNKWQTYEGKPVKNSDLLNTLDRARKKLTNLARRRVSIEYHPRRFNKKADALSKQGKKFSQTISDIALKSVKPAARLFDGEEVLYSRLEKGCEYIVRIYKKDAVQDQWEVLAEFANGDFKGKKIKIYVPNDTERKLHRYHFYNIRLENVHKYHVTIYKTIKEIKNLMKD